MRNICLRKTVLLLTVCLSLFAGETEKVNLQLRWKHQFQFAGYYMAKELGYYSDAGFDVNILEGGTYTDVMEEVLSGKADFGVQTPSILVDRAKGSPAVVLAAVFQHSPVALLVNSGSGIDYLAQLEGKKLMIGLKNVEIRAMLLNEDMLEKVDIVEFNGNYAEVTEGKYEASSGYITDMTYVEDQTENTFKYIRPLTYGVDFYGDCLFTTEEIIKNSPEKVDAFLSASLKGWGYAMEHPEEAVKLITVKYNKDLLPEHLLFEYRQMKKLILPDLVEIGHMSRGRWKHILETFQQVGMINDDFDMSGFLYSDYEEDRHTFLRNFLVITTCLFLLGMIYLYIKYRREKIKEVLEEAKHKKQLEESEAKFRGLIEFGADGILLGSHDGYILEVNEMACSIVGMKREDLIGKFVTAVPFTKESLEKAPLRFDLLREGKIVVTERDLLRSDGSIVNVEMKTKMMSDGTLQSIFRDVTEKKNYEKELRIFMEAVEFSTDGVGMSTPEGKHYYQNRKFTEMFGKISENPPESLYTDTEKGNEVFKAIMAGKDWSGEVEMNSAGGNIIPIMLRAYAIKNEDGIVTGLVGIHTDITPLKMIEKKLKDFNMELEKKVAERTSQLELANRELESFSYSVSHDLRAPVRHIIGFTDIFMKENAGLMNERSKDTFSKITSSAHRMERLIDDLLKLSRTGRQEMLFKKVSMEKILKNVMAEYKDCKEQKQVESSIGSMPEVYADLNLIAIVWENLIDNACKYTRDQEKVKIEISCKEENDEYVFCIKDNGVGFEPEFKHKLFGVFQRLHLEKDFSGSGIGLANVRRIISRHGGRTWAESGGEGKGAAFYFSLPKNQGGI